MKLVYYSLAVTNLATALACERQWTQSIRSLREYNGTIPVSLFIYGVPSRTLLKEADRHSVATRVLGEYKDCFTGVPSSWHPALSYYPTFHKFLSLQFCNSADVSQILYLDSDTFFFGDVESLFARYKKHDWYAREEPRSQRSPHGYDASRIDEALLYKIASAEGLVAIPPYQSGVCILNNGIWDVLASLSNQLLTYAWRLLVGLSMLSVCPSKLAEMVNSSTDLDRQYFLFYPSRNGWILDQIALWLTLGRIPALTHEAFTRQDVLQNGEYLHAFHKNSMPIVTHYFNSCERGFFELVSRNPGKKL